MGAKKGQVGTKESSKGALMIPYLSLGSHRWLHRANRGPKVTYLFWPMTAMWAHSELIQAQRAPKWGGGRGVRTRITISESVF